ncbi:MAG TPA: hypothetical protein VE398_07270 [Acidobacteriota bacterium]|nr:hypothetical protein [Acidobacteriota bacterium]
MKETVGIPQRYERCTLDNFEPLNLSQVRALGEARKFVERYPCITRGLIFAGETGTGKTHLAAAMLRELAGRVPEDLLFVNFESIQSCQGGSPLHDCPRLQQVSLLVLDNFGIGTPTAETLRSVEQLLEARLHGRRLTILTGAPVRCRDLFRGRTSLDASPTQLFLSALDPALLMKLLSAVRVISVTGDDYRRSHHPLFP